LKERLEIEAEIRGLLEEIVGDPRSSVRFAPRRPLREWFDGGEAIRARSLDGTSAERHLVAAHREALAATLLEAAKIAYWKAPVLSLRPIGPDGEPYDERVAEERWKPLARRRSEHSIESGGVDLLRACLSEIPADQGHELAQASLSLVPNDAARYYVTRTLPWDRPRTAIYLLRRLVEGAPNVWKREAWSSLGARLCSIGEAKHALDAHREASNLTPGGSLDLMCAFNLWCLLGEDRQALVVAREVVPIIGKEVHRVQEMVELLRLSWQERSGPERNKAMDTAARVRGDIPESALVLCDVFQP
jgi:hypothetical protein